MKILRAAAYLPVTWLLLACASPVPRAALPGFGKSLASELDGLDAAGLDIVYADDAGRLWVQDAERSKKRALASGLNRSGFELTAAARGLTADGGAFRWDWLATLSREPEAGLGVLSIHDAEGRLAHEEVLLEDCANLAWREGDAPELLVGCGERVWRYLPGPASEPVLTSAQFPGSGGAFGPLSFGDSRARVHAALQLEGATCGTAQCSLWAIQMDERDFMLAPEFENGRLMRVSLFGPRRSRPEWRTKVRADWAALAARFTGDAASAEAPFPSVNALAPIPQRDGWFFGETHRPQRAGVKAIVGVYRDDNTKGHAFGAVAILSPAPAAAAAVPAAAAE